MEMRGGGRGEGEHRHKQVVWDGSNLGILGFSLDRQRPHDDFLRLQTLNPRQVNTHKVCHRVQDLRDLVRCQGDATWSQQCLNVCVQNIWQWTVM